LRIPIAKIGIFLLLIVILPPVFFSAYEVTNMYQNEQMIDSIYKSQLGSIIFSINQYSDDIVNDWASDLEDIERKAGDKSTAYGHYLQQHSSVILVFIVDSTDSSRIYGRSEVLDTLTDANGRVAEMMENNQDKLARLRQYIKTGYRKIEPIDLVTPNVSLFLFAINTDDKISSLKTGIICRCSLNGRYHG
jgi:two-component system phosphate regulon sensor histidine kinase PhoR